MNCLHVVQENGSKAMTSPNTKYRPAYFLLLRWLLWFASGRNNENEEFQYLESRYIGAVVRIGHLSPLHLGAGADFDQSIELYSQHKKGIPMMERTALALHILSHCGKSWTFLVLAWPG